MQVLCYSNDESVEIRCPECGQGFALFWGLQTETDKVESLESMVRTLKTHPCIGSGARANQAQRSLAPA